MATSGSYDYNLTGLQIITEALGIVGTYDPGEALTTEDSATCLITLESMIKFWQAEGIGLWKNTEVALFLELNEYKYSVGSTGDHASKVWVKTELAADAALGAGSITVDSIAGVTNADKIGVELDDGTLQWTTVNGVPAGTTITLAAVLTSAASTDNHVYTYTTKIIRPKEIIEARIRNANEYDTPLIIKSRDEYMRVSNKASTGTANQIYYDPKLSNGLLYVWPACNDVQSYIVMTARMPIEDFDATSNDPDFGQEWLLPLSWNLAVLIAPKFGAKLSPVNLAIAGALKQAASDFDREEVSVFLKIKNRR